MPNLGTIVATVSKVWIVPIPAQRSDSVLADTLRGYRTYAVIAVCFLVLAARTIPGSGGGIAAAFVSSAAAAIIVGVLDFVFGARRIFIQFSWLVTAFVQLALFIAIDLVGSGLEFYWALARETDWHIPGLVIAGLLTLAVLLIRSAMRGLLSLRAAGQACVMVLGSTVLFALVLGLDDRSLLEILERFFGGGEG